MLYATERVVRLFDGSPLKFMSKAPNGSEPAEFESQTVGEQLATMLLTAELPAGAVERALRFMLAGKLSQHKGPHELDSKELTLLRTVLDATKLPLMVWGQLDAVLDGKPDPITGQQEMREPPALNGHLPVAPPPA